MTAAKIVWKPPNEGFATRSASFAPDEADDLLPASWRMGWTEHAYWLAPDASGPVDDVELHRALGGLEPSQISRLMMSLSSRPGGAADPALDMLGQLRATPHASWPSRLRRMGAETRTLRAFP